MQDLLKSFLISLVTSVAVLFALGPIMLRLQAADVALPNDAAAPIPSAAGTGGPAAPPDVELTAPKVLGMKVEDARSRWRGEGIAIIEDSQRVEQGATPGEIIEQNPEPGAVLRQLELRVIVAAAAESAAVPSAIGKPVAVARELLVAAGFEVPPEEFEASDAEPGTVVRQEPNPGAQLAKGSVVRLYVPAEPATIAVPRMIGKRQAEATKMIVEAGLVLGNVSRREHEELSGGRVMGQSPDAGTEVAAGSTVNLVVVAPD